MIDRTEVESLLACMEQIHKPNNGVIAELCRVYLAYLDAPQAKAQESDTPNTVEILVWAGEMAPGTQVRLVTDAEAK